MLLRQTFLLLLFLLWCSSNSVSAQEKFLLQNNQRVVFLGDSNTFAGTYIAYIDAYLFTRFPDKKFELINLGLPSETVSGLSEPDHPYPRPNVHERLERVLAKTKPDIVIACYGMNDGIYYPFSEERFSKFRLGMKKLIERVGKAEAKMVLVTPAPFDPVPIQKQVRPLGELKYSWLQPYEKYDDTLDKYAGWLLTLKGQGPVIAVTDAHGATRRFLAEVRKQEPRYYVAADGIHPNSTGHALIASQVLEALSAPDEADLVEVDVKMRRALTGLVKDVRVTDREISFEWTSKLPWPTRPYWHPRLAELEKLRERFNRYELIVARAASPRYAILEDNKKIGEATRAEVRLGLDMTRFPDLSTNARAAAIWRLVQKREQVLGLAWLTDVGHNRPGTPKGLPLAQAQKQASNLEEQIRVLARPRPLALRLVGLEK